MNKILRVFPRQTNATPFDELVRFGFPDMLPIPKVDEVHVSVTFSWDIDYAQQLYSAWSDQHEKVFIGGPAMGDPGSEFIPGLYLADGFTISSRGCPNNCWFCDVPKREGSTRELPIRPGHKVLDSNLLACSSQHIESVFEMLRDQDKPAEFLGGLDAERLTPYWAKQMREIKTDRIFCAYDEEADYIPLLRAGKTLAAAGFTRHHLYAYVLIGFPKDSTDWAGERLVRTWDAGFMPFAMLWRNQKNETPSRSWRMFQREWVRPAIIRSKMMSKSA